MKSLDAARMELERGALSSALRHVLDALDDGGSLKVRIEDGCGVDTPHGMHLLDYEEDEVTPVPEDAIVLCPGVCQCGERIGALEEKVHDMQQLAREPQ